MDSNRFGNDGDESIKHEFRNSADFDQILLQRIDFERVSRRRLYKWLKYHLTDIRASKRDEKLHKQVFRIVDNNEASDCLEVFVRVQSMLGAEYTVKFLPELWRFLLKESHTMRDDGDDNEKVELDKDKERAERKRRKKARHHHDSKRHQSEHRKRSRRKYESDSAESDSDSKQSLKSGTSNDSDSSVARKHRSRRKSRDRNHRHRSLREKSRSKSRKHRHRSEDSSVSESGSRSSVDRDEEQERERRHRHKRRRHYDSDDEKRRRSRRHRHRHESSRDRSASSGDDNRRDNKSVYREQNDSNRDRFHREPAAARPVHRDVQQFPEHKQLDSVPMKRLYEQTENKNQQQDRTEYAAVGWMYPFPKKDQPKKKTSNMGLQERFGTSHERRTSGNSRMIREVVANDVVLQEGKFSDLRELLAQSKSLDSSDGSVARADENVVAQREENASELVKRLSSKAKIEKERLREQLLKSRKTNVLRKEALKSLQSAKKSNGNLVTQSSAAQDTPIVEIAEADGKMGFGVTAAVSDGSARLDGETGRQQTVDGDRILDGKATEGNDKSTELNV
mmetsp:Transcript_637/g.1144  ORF Transcript_637/g.1144 Transcript_637/m.1144 type:complete len:565 (-) Transcript_637:1393-3087(-)